ncbi:MAG TPA: cytochrome c oxidase subunit 3, partial [Dehalococcoidia bacterium]|nr:cytochrome c oxidase subunit 3 [Dehalococcoidia bacterium]
MQAERAAAAERPWQSAVYLGMLLFLVSEAFLFGSLFWIYYYLKDNTPIWPPAGVDFGRALAVVNTAILLASSGTMYLATRAIRRGSLEGLVAELTVTFLLGALFLFNTGWE